MLHSERKIYVAGHTGLVGSAIKRKLKELSYARVITKTHKELDLASKKNVESFPGVLSCIITSEASKPKICWNILIWLGRILAFFNGMINSEKQFWDQI